MLLKKNAGFSLIEVLVTVLVTAIGLLSVTDFQTTQMFESASAKNRTEATELAQQRMEQFRAYATLAEFEAFVGGGDAGVLRGESAEYIRTWTIDRSGVTPLTGNVITVRVNVSWNDRTGSDTPQQVSLSSAVAFVDPAGAVALYP